NQDVINDWDSAGCMENIKRKLGYRFVLRKAVLPTTSGKTGTFKIQLPLENIGYASPYNPRIAKIIFRNIKSKKEYQALLKAKPPLDICRSIDSLADIYGIKVTIPSTGKVSIITGTSVRSPFYKLSLFLVITSFFINLFQDRQEYE